MKNSKLMTIMVATTLVTSALAAGTAGAASAKPTNQAVKKAVAKKAVAYKVVDSSINVNGSNVTLKSILVNQTPLYAVSDLAKALKVSATLSKGTITLTDTNAVHTVNIQPQSLKYLVNSANLTFKTAPIAQDGRTYVELGAIVEAIGGEVITGQADKVNRILSVKRLSGTFDTLHWDATGNIVATQEDGETAQLYKINKSTYASESLSTSASAGSMTVSPDGQLGAFIDDNNMFSLLTISNGQVQILGSDTSVKTDLRWSADNKKVYFIQGDKQEKISYISLDTGKITTVLADKVENKSDVRVSSDETKIVYIVNITGVAKTDKDGTEESLTIDYSGAGAQVYSLDIATKDAKPAQLTKSNDNKLYPALLSGGNVVYMSADADNVSATNVIKLVTVDGKSQDLVSNIDVTFEDVSYDGIIIVAGIAKDGSMKVIKVDSNGTQVELFSTKNDISEVALSPDGTQLAVISDGKVIVITNGQQIQLTQ
ncbi:stalk domain-containing protein [Paenibacillus macquariensis]|uniref:WD40-like Beta Propeller Repeat n=1 Tax=Paenibacillus macquariensis TaxID=948756 RepID=A0ABY1JTA7_9BACL|nr:stalk domain-containing protein [Paenibacillus macquariensis]MEC0093082.1 stalk domain-containing protein [Paenibacillus macquariensis]OAB36428.1 hypothetical protein PMSM_08300 [Paenibacillus macquariensis subsp. macquariensis]SIQ72269.1 WD40-like Beta Propeller Repeat [Paenibacillus macquariensis]